MMALRRLFKNSSKKSLEKMVNGIPKKREEPAIIEDRQNSQSPEPLPVEEETPKKYWPCAPDGFIPNSVVRKFFKAKPPTKRQIPRLKRQRKDFWTLWKSLQASLIKQNGTSTSEESLTVDEEDDGEREIEKEEEEEEQEVVEQEESSQESSETSSESSLMCSPTEIQESPEILVQESDDTDISESPSSDTDEVDSALRHLLSRIQGKDWYPTLQKRTIPTLDTVLDNMLGALKTENSPENIKDICKEFQSIEREFGIPDEKMSEIQKQLITMTSNEDPLIRRAAVWALGQLNVHRNDAYLSLVRRLVDDDGDTRLEATKVLKGLTGVETKEGLCRLFIDMGVVNVHLPSNDNAVLLELAERLELSKYEKRATVTDVEEDDEKASSLNDLRTTSRRKPFKAKFKHPKTMKKRSRGAPAMRRKHSIFDRPVSLRDTDKFKAILADSALGCKLLQNMEPSRPNIMHGQVPERAKDVNDSLEIGKKRSRGAPAMRRKHSIFDRPASLGCKLLQNVEPSRPNIMHGQAPERAKDVNDSLEIGGVRVFSLQRDQEWRKDNDEMQRDDKGTANLASTSRRFSCRGTMSGISTIDLYSSFSKQRGLHIPATTSRRFSHRDTMTQKHRVAPITEPTASMSSVSSLAVWKPNLGSSMQKDHKTQSTAPSQGLSHRTQRTTSSRELSQRTTALQSRMEHGDKKRQTLFHQQGHAQYLTLKGILSVLETMGVNQPSAKLLLLRLRRTKRIIAKQISVDNNTIQPYYSFGDLLETCCNLPPLVDILTTLARKAAKTTQEMVMSMRGLFQSELLSSTRKGDFVVINGQGRLPAEYHDELQEIRLEVLERVKKCLENDELFSSSKVEMAKSFTSLLEHLLWFCAILEPEIEVHETTHTSGMETLGLTAEKTISRTREISFSRKKTDEQAQPIFEQTSLRHCLGPGTHGQRLLNSTLIRAKALSDSKVRTSKETEEFVVMPLPHRLSVHTGMKREGESHFGIMELTWRAGTPLPSSKSEACRKERASSLSELSGKLVELEEHYRLKEKKQKPKSKIPKSKSVPPLSHRKMKPFAEKQITLFQAVSSWNSKDSLLELIEYINNKNIIKKKFLEENENLLPGSLIDVTQPPSTTTPLSVLVSPASRMISNDAMTSVKSGESFRRCSTFYDQPHDLTRDTLLRDLDEFHLPPIWRLGGHNRRR